MPNYDLNFSEEKKSEGKQKISALMCISAPIVAVKVAVTKNLVAVKGPKVAVVLVWSGSEGLSGSGNPVSQSRASSRWIHTYSEAF